MVRVYTGIIRSASHQVKRDFSRRKLIPINRIHFIWQVRRTPRTPLPKEEYHV